MSSTIGLVHLVVITSILQNKYCFSSHLLFSIDYNNECKIRSSHFPFHVDDYVRNVNNVNFRFNYVKLLKHNYSVSLKLKREYVNGHDCNYIEVT